MSVRESPTEEDGPLQIEYLNSEMDSVTFVEVGNSKAYIKVDESLLVDVER